MATKDKMETTAGSWALLGCKVPKDAHIVALLRKSGAIILGKANLDEWAGMRSTSYSCGFSARGGQCRNAYRLNRSPSQFCPLALPDFQGFFTDVAANVQKMVVVPEVLLLSRLISSHWLLELKQIAVSSVRGW